MILLNIEISIESSLCVSFSVCVCASSPALFRSLELTTTTLPSFFISSSLPLPIFVLGRPKNYRYCLPTMSTGGGISPLISSRSTLRPQRGFTGLWRAWNLVEGREKAVLRVCVGVRKRDIIIEASCMMITLYSPYCLGFSLHSYVFSSEIAVLDPHLSLIAKKLHFIVISLLSVCFDIRKIYMSGK